MTPPPITYEYTEAEKIRLWMQDCGASEEEILDALATLDEDDE